MVSEQEVTSCHFLSSWLSQFCCHGDIVHVACCAQTLQGDGTLLAALWSTPQMKTPPVAAITSPPLLYCWSVFTHKCEPACAVVLRAFIQAFICVRVCVCECLCVCVWYLCTGPVSKHGPGWCQGQAAGSHPDLHHLHRLRALSHLPDRKSTRLNSSHL